MDRVVVCAKWGDRYCADDVNRLARAVRKNCVHPVSVLCLTDDPDGIDRNQVRVQPLGALPFESEMALVQARTRKPDGALKKIALFQPDLFPNARSVIAMDLDVVVVGDIGRLFDVMPGKVAMAAPFRARSSFGTLGEGSVTKFEPDKHQFLYHDMAANPTMWTLRAEGSEQSYTSNAAHSRGVLAHFPDTWVRSFKHDCRPFRPFNLLRAPRFPDGASIVCFHGKPKIQEALSGYRGGFLKSTRPATWINAHWN